MKNRRILLVDEFDAMRDLLTEVFEQEGYHVQTVANGWQARDAIARATFDLILVLDLDLPLPGGPELGEALRQRFVRMPVVGMAANPTRVDPTSDLRVSAVIGKPIPFATLLALVHDVIYRTDKLTSDPAPDSPT